MKLIINDVRIWDPMTKAAEILYELKLGPVEIHLNNESPALEETELPAFFDFIACQGADLSKITITTGNPLETYDRVNIVFDPTAMFELEHFQMVAEQIPKTKDIQYHFGSLVSRTTLPRLVLSSFLYANHRNKTFQTFHYNHNSDYHKTHLELDRLIHEYGPNSVEFDEAVMLLKSSPLLKEEVETYPILHPENLMTPCNWYSSFAVDIICETWYQGSNFFVTEKFWRAVATKTPFIIHGPQNILTNLKKLGFKTFSDFWDEGYQEDPYYHNIYEIKQVINELSKKSVDEINFMLYNMQDILDHNYSVFMNVTYQDFNKIYE
jgi:hypothetical protein